MQKKKKKAVCLHMEVRESENRPINLWADINNKGCRSPHLALYG